MARRFRNLLLAGLLLFSQLTLTLAVPASQVSAADSSGITTLVNTPTGAQLNGDSYASAISGNGRYVVFSSSAYNLLPGDMTGSWFDYFMKDLETGTTTLISQNSDEQWANGRSQIDASISYDGRFVAFVADAANLSPESTIYNQVYVRDTQLGTTSLVSKGPTNNAPSQSSRQPMLSADGRYVVFTSEASLTSGDNNYPKSDIYVRNLQTNTTTLVSVNAANLVANGYSDSARISGDGRFIAFESSATDIVPNDTNGQIDVFVRDMVTGVTTRVSEGPNGEQSNGHNPRASVSSDGRYISFISTATNLVAEDTNQTGDIYIKDMQTGALTLGTVGTNGERSNNGVGGSPFISSDGRYLVFYTLGKLTPEDNNNTADVYIRDTLAGTTNRLTVGLNGAEANGYSSLLTHGGPTITDDNKTVVFTSTASNLVQSDVNARQDVFIHELQTDSVAPSVVGSADRAPDFGDWYSNDVTIAWQATDPDPSSGTPTDPADTVASQEGEQTYTSGQSCDPAGNCATGSLTLKIDKSAPVLGVANFSPDPITFGTDSTLTVPVTEPVSGVGLGEYFIGSDPGQGNGTSMNWDGTNLTATLGASLPVGTHTVNIRARDNAGNWSSVSTATLTVQDNTAPVITYELSQMPGLGGWYNAPVTLTWSVTDPESAITSQTGCDPATINADTAGTIYTCEAISAGGTSSESATIMYDATAPVAGTPLWSVNPLPIATNTTLTVPVIETLSGVTNGEYFIDTDPGAGNGTAMTWDGVNNNLSAAFGASLQPGVYTVGIRAKDLAGNWGAVTYDYLVVYNPAGPTDIAGKKTFVPSLANGDVLPGLISQSQTDDADFGFDVFYTATGAVDPASEFTFCYDLSNHKCKKPQNNPFSLTATSFSLLSVSGAYSEVGIFQGEATVTANGATSTMSFRVEVLDADLTPQTTDVDHLVLKIYPVGGSPSTLTYQVSADITGGNNLKIQ